MNEMPVLPQRHAREVQGTQGEGGGDAVPAPPLPDLPAGEHIAPDDALDGGVYGDGDGAGDPAFAFFRSDWYLRWSQRRGYAGPAGFAKYLKEAGIISPKRRRIVRDHEITGTDLDREHSR